MLINKESVFGLCEAWPCPRGLWLIGYFLLMSYALFGILLDDLGGISGTLMALIGLLSILRYGRNIRSSFSLWLLLFVIFVQTVSWIAGYLSHPEWVASNPRLDRLGKLFIFIAIAWWLGGSTNKTLFIWSLALLGYLIASFAFEGPGEWLRGFQGERVGFGIRNGQHGSMLFGIFLIGWIVFSKRIFVRSDGALAIWKFLLWTMVLTICISGVAIGQTRAVWLGCLTAFIGTLMLLFLLSRSFPLRKKLRVGFSLLIILIFFIIFFYLFFLDFVLIRVSKETFIVSQLLNGDFSEIPYTSVGIRIHSWLAAFEWIKERPLVGWGSEGRGLVIDHTSWLPQFVKDNFGHLHNYLIEVLVAYGSLGFLSVIALYGWVGRAVWLAWRSGNMPNDIAIFAFAFFLYWVVVNQFESYNSFGTGVFVHNIVLGGLVTHYWKFRYEVVKGSPPDLHRL